MAWRGLLDTQGTFLTASPPPIGDWREFQDIWDLYQKAGKLPDVLVMHPDVFEFWKCNYVTGLDGQSIAGLKVVTDSNQHTVTSWNEVFQLSQSTTAGSLMSPEEIVDSLQDRIHPTSGKLIGSKPVVSPKSLDSSHKVPVTLCPASAIIAIALVIAQGHKKPGRTIYNWRKQPISLMGYMDAVERHLLKSRDGEDFDKELSDLAGVPIRHDWAAMSGLAIIEDARQAGTLNDDRPTKGGASEFLASVTILPKPPAAK